jgi:hypothetical protein
MFKPFTKGRRPGIFVAALILTAIPANFERPALDAGSPPNRVISVEDNFDPGILKDWQMPYPEDRQILEEGGLHWNSSSKRE